MLQRVGRSQRPASPSSDAARRGAILGLLAAASFGLSAPVAKRLLADLSPQQLAGLLYVGAGVALTVYRGLRRATDEAPLQRSDAPTLTLLVLCGGIAGPLLMLFGLQRTTAVTGSLLLNLEAPFTIALAVLLFGEHLGRRAAMAIVLVLAGVAVLGFHGGSQGTDLIGAALLAAACAAWALDNNLTQRLSLRDPIAIVRVKTLVAGGANLTIGVLLGGWPDVRVVAIAMTLGAVSYGASVVLDAYALRLIGAAREAAYFATAPFMGALASTVVVGERIAVSDAIAMAVMAGGIALLLRERHGHTHVHEPIEHLHVHVHDEHHRHEHDAADPPGEPHAHTHTHARLEHDHEHVPDLHHRHEHAD